MWYRYQTMGRYYGGKFSRFSFDRQIKSLEKGRVVKEVRGRGKYYNYQEL